MIDMHECNAYIYYRKRVHKSITHFNKICKHNVPVSWIMLTHWHVHVSAVNVVPVGPIVHVIYMYTYSTVYCVFIIVLQLIDKIKKTNKFSIIKNI